MRTYQRKQALKSVVLGSCFIVCSWTAALFITAARVYQGTEIGGILAAVGAISVIAAIGTLIIWND